MPTFSKLSLLAAAALASPFAYAAPVDIHLPGFTLPSSSTIVPNTMTNGVSGDGLTSVGSAYGPGFDRAFKIVGANFTVLSNLPGGTGGYASAASQDGSIIVGAAYDSNSYEQAVYWSGLSQPVLLDAAADFLYSSAEAISSDGLTIVGSGISKTSVLNEAFYFRAGSLTNFSAVFSGFESKASGVSANGNLIVGKIVDSFALSTPDVMNGFIYAVTGTVGNSGLRSVLVDASAISAFNSLGLSLTELTAISGNGAVAAGSGLDYVGPGNNQRAFKYTIATEAYEALGTLGGNSIARAVSNDGTVIVGSSNNQAFVHQNGSMTGLGFLTSGTSSEATGVSADGSVIVGFGNTTGGYTHAFVYANQTMLDADEWMRSLNGPGSLLAMTNNLHLLPLEGAHHRPLMSYDAMGKTRQVWATGDFGNASRQVDRNTTVGEIGFSQAAGDFVFGLTVGHAALNQDLLFGGSAHIAGNTLLAEVDYRLADKESIVSLVVMRGDWDAQTNRAYVTGGGTDSSQGNTALQTSSIRLRYDGPAQPCVGALSVAPFASFALTRTTADAYQEVGGSFPASFTAQAHTAQEGRLGLTAKVVASPSTTLRFTAEWIHRFDGAGDGLTGTSLTTSSGFTAAGTAPTANQARLGFDIDHKLSADTLINLSLHAAGMGPSSDLAAALSIRRAF